MIQTSFMKSQDRLKQALWNPMMQTTSWNPMMQTSFVKSHDANNFVKSHDANKLCEIPWCKQLREIPWCKQASWNPMMQTSFVKSHDANKLREIPWCKQASWNPMMQTSFVKSHDTNKYWIGISINKSFHWTIPSSAAIFAELLMARRDLRALMAAAFPRKNSSGFNITESKVLTRVWHKMEPPVLLLNISLSPSSENNHYICSNTNNDKNSFWNLGCIYIYFTRGSVWNG